jgi:hypothetical protein
MKCSRGQGASNGGSFIRFGGVLAEIWVVLFLVLFYHVILRGNLEISGFKVIRVGICPGLVIMKCSMDQGASNGIKFIDFGGFYPFFFSFPILT